METGLCIVALVGENMKNQQGISGKMFSTLGKNNVNIRAIAQGVFHSYYKDKIGVIIDPVENSPLWEICRRFYVYALSWNTPFLQRWKTKKAA